MAKIGSCLSIPRSTSVRRRSHRSLLKAVAPLIVAGTLTLAATAAAAGFDPAQPTPIPDSAFSRVSVPPPAPAPRDLPMAATRATRVVLPPDRDPAAEILANLAKDQADRPQPNVREPNRIVVKVPPPKPVTTHVLRGPASWYCRAGVSPCTYTNPDGGGFDAYAAAGPKLRAAIGASWRGTVVWVDGIRVKLIDWCQCYQGERHEKLLDLYYDVYARTGTAVTIRW
jgi:hypothetical protein